MVKITKTEDNNHLTSKNKGETKWGLAKYRPVTLFSLRMSQATSSGGKTLLVPTPYSYKIALVDAAIRAGGLGLAKEVFNWVKGREVRFCPPEKAVVNQTFIKLLRLARASGDNDKNSGPYQRTIGYREFCHFNGELIVAVAIGGLTDDQINKLGWVAAHINYLGKRGSFMQFLSWQVSDFLPDNFTCPAGEIPAKISCYGVGEFLDDLGGLDEENLFERINVYSEKGIVLNKHRILVHHLIPYQLTRSSKGYTAYERRE